MEQALQSGKSLTYEQLISLFHETSKQFKETDKQFKETDKQFKETDRKFQETDKQFKETDRKFKDLCDLLEKSSNEFNKKLQESDKKFAKRMKYLDELFIGQWGKLVESLIEGKLVQMLRERGIAVEFTETRLRSESKDMEIDIVAENGEEIVAVEVKTTLNVDKINEFIEKLDIFKSTFPKFKDKNVIGAVAYLRCDEGSVKYAKKKGLFVIRATGDSAKIINDSDFKPKYW